MFAILAGRSAFADGADGLGLKWPFVFGALLALAGVAMLLYSFFAGGPAGAEPPPALHPKQKGPSW